MKHRAIRRVLALGAAVALSAMTVTGLSAVPAAAAPGSSAEVTVGTLQVDSATNPLGIDNETPSLSWKLTSDVQSERQSAYRIIVASSEAKLADPGSTDVWDSGKVESAESVGITYDGPTLASQSRYFWAVQVWDAEGKVSAWSDAAWWEMGLLDSADWRGAEWITPQIDGSASWSNFVLDADFTVTSGAASFLLRAKDSKNLYMWQINTALDSNAVLLRPHKEVNGSFSHVGDDVDVAPAMTKDNARDQHHITIKAEGDTFTTWIDGTLVDTRTDDTFSAGTIGFRVGDSTENALYDNLAVHDLDDNLEFSDDFSTSPDSSFPGTAIADGQLHPGNGIVLLDPSPSAPLLRTSFDLDKPVASARAYAYGLGLYELHLNGNKVGDRVLTPSSAPYDQRNLYETYDITDQLTSGENAVGIWLGDGYDSQFSAYAFRWLGPKQAILLVDVTYTDGTHRVVTTDDDWRWSNSAITSNGIYSGENYDARAEQRGWDSAGFDDSQWNRVKSATAPSPNLVSNDVEPIRVVESLEPVKMTEPKPGVYIYDLGQNIAGWLRLSAEGPSGTTVTMRTAEELGEDGLLDTFTNRNAASTDNFTLAGTGDVETYEPRFTYHGFRYVEVTGFPGTPTISSISGQVVHVDVHSTGTFSSSDVLLNQIWQNNRWAILNNSMSTPTDTPVRDERTPPGMDVQAYHSASTTEFAMDRFYAKYLQDMPAGTALPNDDIKSQYPDMAGDGVTLPWTLYQQYGDAATLALHYAGMKTFVDTNATDVPSHIWPASQGFGDWCPPDLGPNANDGMGNASAGDCFSEVSIVNTALSYLQAIDVAKAAKVLGHEDDAEHFTRLASDIKDAFNDNFLNEAGDTYGDGRQTTSILPLAFGMVPEVNLKAVGDQFVDTIMNKDDGHLDTGIFGTRYLMDALSNIGQIDVAMTVLGQTTYPGFGFEISKGATTPWEEWTYYSAMETHDHAMFAGINASFYSQLAGIQPESGGYQTVVVDPQIPDSLEHVSASIDTSYGIVSSSWQQSADRFTLDVTVPVNSTATIHVPTRGFAQTTATPGAKLVTSKVTALAAGDMESVYEVGSGTWHFVSGAVDQPTEPPIDPGSSDEGSASGSSSGGLSSAEDNLAATGSDFSGMILLIPMMLGAGVFLLLRSRRRSRV